MTTREFDFTLTRPARSSGGDRYEHGKKGDDDFMAQYYPQSISRPDVDGTPVERLRVTIDNAA